MAEEATDADPDGAHRPTVSNQQAEGALLKAIRSWQLIAFPPPSLPILFPFPNATEASLSSRSRPPKWIRNIQRQPFLYLFLAPLTFFTTFLINNIAVPIIDTLMLCFDVVAFYLETK